MAEWHSSKEWREARTRARKTLLPLCNYCGKDLVGNDFTIDHIVPPSQSPGGIPNHAADNLQALCRSCNSRKQDTVQVRTNWRSPKWYN
jgi:5-methylcytosine-specific restriction endonuclease McrA